MVQQCCHHTGISNLSIYNTLKNIDIQYHFRYNRDVGDSFELVSMSVFLALLDLFIVSTDLLFRITSI